MIKVKQNRKSVTVTTKYRTFIYVCMKHLDNQAIQDAVQRMYPTEAFHTDRGESFYKIGLTE